MMKDGEMLHSVVNSDLIKIRNLLMLAREPSIVFTGDHMENTERALAEVQQNVEYAFKIIEKIRLQ